MAKPVTALMIGTGEVRARRARATRRASPRRAGFELTPPPARRPCAPQYTTGFGLNSAKTDKAAGGA